MTKEKTILVVGDYVVDEHWVTGIHRSKTSSRTGLSHVRSLHSYESVTHAFCAAGQTASILEQSVSENNTTFGILGLGLWHKDDDRILSAMLRPEHLANYTNYSLSKSSILEGIADNDMNLFNLGNLIKNVNIGTTKIIRIYQYTGAKVELIKRIDWEMKIPQGKDGWITTAELAHENKNKLIEFLTQKKIDAVVIKDICKGAISRDLIRWLASFFKEENIHAPWFISSKEWEPKWLEDLGEINVNLFMIPQVASNSAINNMAIDCWMTKNGHVTSKAIDKIDSIKKQYFKKSQPIIIVLPDQTNFIARDFSMNKSVIGIEKFPLNLIMKVQMASVFFAAISAIILSDTNSDLIKMLSNAIGYTEEWMEAESRRVVNTDSWRPDHNRLNLNRDYETKLEIAELDWEKCKREWKEPFDINSFKPKNPNRRIDQNSSKDVNVIELWRAMIEVDGYICLVEKKRKCLQMLVKELKSFKSKKRMKHMSCLIMASPGSGKSFLIDCLEKALDITCVRINITNMISKDEILNYFDRILTTQALSPDKPIMVFVDEINAKINSEFVYSTFLSPLENGVFVRAEKNFPLRPCFWIFAGTVTPKESARVKGSGEENVDASSKAGDFESRLSLPIINLKKDENGDDTEEARIEILYQAVALLRAEFSDVRKVSKKVLNLFCLIKPASEIRNLKHFIGSFANIQYGQVLSSNIISYSNKSQNIKKLMATQLFASKETLEFWFKESGDDEIVEILD